MIEHYAFFRCSSLAVVKIPNAELTSEIKIQLTAFRGCSLFPMDDFTQYASISFAEFNQNIHYNSRLSIKLEDVPLKIMEEASHFGGSIDY